MTLAIRAATAYLDAVAAVDSALCRACVYRWPRALVLDTILGPAEDPQYVSTTTPSSPPPTI